MQSREGHKQKVCSSKRESLVRLIKKTEKKKKTAQKAHEELKKGYHLTQMLK